MKKNTKLKLVHLKFYQERPNAGDQFSLALARHYLAEKVIPCTKKPLTVPNLIIVGSYLIAADAYSHVCGAGFIATDPIWSRLSAKPRFIHCVRGPLTADLLEKQGIQCPKIFADPGILAPKLYPQDCLTRYKIGVVPHFLDANSAWVELCSRRGLKIIDPLGPLKTYFEHIQQCEIILSSSLHGIIFAHAYGKAALWIELSDQVIGNGFKFYDYYASIGVDLDKVNRVQIAKDTDPFEIAALAAFGNQKKLIAPLEEAMHNVIDSVRKDQRVCKTKGILIPFSSSNREMLVGKLKKYRDRLKTMRSYVNLYLHGGPSKQHSIYFIVGCGRSGTHYLARIIATSKEVFLTYEQTDIFTPVVDHVLLPDKSLAPAIKCYKSYHWKHRIYVDKSHPNLFNTDALLSVFPEAKFIGIYRNVFETVASMLKHKGCVDWVKHYKRYKFPNEFLGWNAHTAERYESATLAGRCAFRWCAHYSKLVQLKEKFQNKLLLINYTDLIEHNKEQIQRLSGFLGVQLAHIPPDKACRDKWKTELTPEQQQEIRDVLEFCGLDAQVIQASSE